MIVLLAVECRVEGGALVDKVAGVLSRVIGLPQFYADNNCVVTPLSVAPIEANEEAA